MVIRTKYIITILAAIFVMSQSWALVHMAQHGDDYHEHEGIACQIKYVAKEHKLVEPVAVPFHWNRARVQALYDTALSSVNIAFTLVRAPPPRSPPH